MVCFTVHVFRVPSENKENWFRLLDKYFSGAQFTIISCGHAISHGKLSYKWLMYNTINITGVIEVKSDRIFDNWATARVLPLTTYDNIQNPEITEIDNVNRICDKITSIISNGTFWDISSSIKVSCSDSIDESDTLTESYDKYIPYIINRICQSPYIIGMLVLGPKLWYVSDGNRIYMITLENVTWAYLPCFDLDDGFLNTECCKMNPEYLDHLNAMFLEWKTKFDQTGGANWDNPIIHN